MARVSPKQHSFARGEISPRLYSRQDTELYYTALQVARNYIVDGRGILERRPGTRLLGSTKDNGPAELLPFVYSQEQSYILELGAGYLRAWFDFGLVQDGGSPSETPTPFTIAEVSDLSFAQSRDVMWLAHANHPTSTITRDTPNSFSLSSFETRDGPYLDVNPNLNATLSITANTSPGNIGRCTFSDNDAGTSTDLPAGVIVGSILEVWDGTALRKITVTSRDEPNNQVETNWTGATIASTQQWSYNGVTAPAGVAVTIEGAPSASSGTMTAIGHAPFDAGRDVGRLVRILEEDQAAEESAGLEERFYWHVFKITAVLSPTEATVERQAPVSSATSTSGARNVTATNILGLNTNTVGGFGATINENGEWTGVAIPATSDWRLGAFYPGNFPSVVTFHQNRLCLGLGNRVYMSSSSDFSNFSPSDADSSVNPDNAITLSIPAVNVQKGATSNVTFLQSLGFQLLVGTPSGLHTLQSSSLGEGFDASNPPTRRPQDSRGAALAEPILVGESVIYLHSSRQKLMGSYYRDSFDRIGAQDLSLPSDHLTEPKIQAVVFQEEPHGIAWCYMDDGSLAGLTIQPEEKVQAWHSHRLGGRFLEGGKMVAPKVESLAVRPLPGGGDDSLHMVVKRTVNGATVRHVEAMQEFRDLGDNARDAWFLDAALRYEGNDDLAKSITFTGTGTSPRAAVTNFTDPVFVDGETLSFHDGTRWHHGRVSNVTAGNDFTWTPTMPNTGPGPADGRWHYVDGTWVQLNPGAQIDIYAPTYVEPGNQIDVTRWSRGVSSLSGLGDYEGESIDLLLDGFPVMGKPVAGGGVSGLPNGHTILAGFHAPAQGRLMSIEAGSQNGSAQDKQRPVYEVVFDVLESRGLEHGTGLPSSYDGAWEQFHPIAMPDNHAVIEGEPLPLYSGTLRGSRDEQGEVTDPTVAWRQMLPLPSTIRGIITRLSQSDGR